MPLPTFKTAEEIPEVFRGEYAEVNGEWVPKAETELAEEKRKRAVLLNEKKEEKRLREEAEKKAADAAREKEARAAGVSEEELKKIRDAEALARKPIEEERDRLKAENRKLKLTDRVQLLYLEHGGMKDRIDDAMRALDPRTDLGDKDGIVFKDGEGNVTTDDAKAFFAKHKLEKPWFYEGTQSSGSGGGGSNGGTVRVTPKPSDDEQQRHADRVRGSL